MKEYGHKDIVIPKVMELGDRGLVLSFDWDFLHYGLGPSLDFTRNDLSFKLWILPFTFGITIVWGY